MMYPEARSSILSNSKLDEQASIQFKPNTKVRADGAVLDLAARDHRMEQDFYQTAEVTDTSPDKISNSYFHDKRDSGALLARGKLTVAEALNKNNQVMAEEGGDQLNDPRKNNFMQSQSPFQQA